MHALISTKLQVTDEVFVLFAYSLYRMCELNSRVYLDSLME